jgi:hypothetical protein
MSKRDEQVAVQRVTIHLEPLDADIPEFYANLSAVVTRPEQVVLTFGRQITQPQPDKTGRYTAKPTVRVIMPTDHLEDLLRKLLQQKEQLTRIRELISKARPAESPPGTESPPREIAVRAGRRKAKT